MIARTRRHLRTVVDGSKWVTSGFRREAERAVESGRVVLDDVDQDVAAGRAVHE